MSKLFEIETLNGKLLKIFKSLTSKRSHVLQVSSKKASSANKYDHPDLFFKYIYRADFFTSPLKYSTQCTKQDS